MKELLEKAYDPEVFRREAHQLVDVLADYLKQARTDSNMPVLPYKHAAKAFRAWSERLEKDEQEDFGSLFSSILEDANHLHHPRYMGHQVVPPIPQLALADFVGAFLNNGNIYEMAPPIMAMERAVVKWVTNRLGMGSNAGGLLTSGGSLGNLTALLAARQQQMTRVWENGYEGKRPVVLVSREAHYCIDRTIKIMGLGQEGVIRVPVDKKYRLDVKALHELYANAIAQGNDVLAAVGTAGTTSTGSFDNLRSIGEFCKTNGLWFHIDAAHGGAAITSKKYAHLLGGIEQADSVVVDLHKMWMTPALATAVLFKEDAHSWQSFRQQADYLIERDQEKNRFDGVTRSIECTKTSIAIKAYFLLKLHGEQVVEEYVDHTFGLGENFGKLIREKPDFELAVEPQCNIVCFRYIHVGVAEEELNELQIQIRKSIVESGTFYLVKTVIEGKVYLRTTLMNPFTTIDDLENLLETIREKGKNL